MPSGQDLYTAVSILRAGGIVAIPTETVYGLAAHAFDASAIVKIFDAKERPRFDPLIVHLPFAPPEDALHHVVVLDEFAPRARNAVRQLTDKYWPGPLTLVLPRHDSVPDLVTSDRPTVAVRMPAHPATQTLLAAFGAPVVAPSANRFGSISPTTADHVRQELEGRIDAVVDAGPTPLGVESTVLAVDADGTARLLRPGALPVEAIEAAIGPVGRSTVAEGAPEAPGQLGRHYAPGTPLQLVDSLHDAVGRAAGRMALLRVLGPVDAEAWRAAGHEVVEAMSLSAGGDLGEAAQRLFATLRELDHCDVDIILAERCPTSEGLGYAISDRLERASRPVEGR